MDRNEIEYKVKSAIFGFAVGDALGVPVEFKSRKELQKKTVTDMLSGGTYGLPAGTWSDDTSMTLAELDVLCDGIDYVKIMEAFCEWKDNGKYSATGECFDIGNATADAIKRFQNGTFPFECGGTDEYDNGNGSLMRIIPFVLFYNFSLDYMSLISEYDFYGCSPTRYRQEVLCREIHKASSLTHGHMCSKTGCFIYAYIFSRLLEPDRDLSVWDKPDYYDDEYNLDKKEFIKVCLDEIREFYHYDDDNDYWIDENKKNETPAYDRILRGDFIDCSEEYIKGNGYIVNSLEAALWCFLSTDSYEECVLKAVNLGSDTDTTAAIAGGLAGVFYGYDSIPQKWLNALKKRDMIEELCERFAESTVPADEIYKRNADGSPLYERYDKYQLHLYHILITDLTDARPDEKDKKDKEEYGKKWAVFSKVYKKFIYNLEFLDEYGDNMTYRDFLIGVFPSALSFNGSVFRLCELDCYQTHSLYETPFYEGAITNVFPLFFNFKPLFGSAFHFDRFALLSKKDSRFLADFPKELDTEEHFDEQIKLIEEFKDLPKPKRYSCVDNAYVNIRNSLTVINFEFYKKKVQGVLDEIASGLKGIYDVSFDYGDDYNDEHYSHRQVFLGVDMSNTGFTKCPKGPYIFSDMLDVFIVCKSLKYYFWKYRELYGKEWELPGFEWIFLRGYYNNDNVYAPEYEKGGYILAKKIASIKDFAEGNFDISEVIGNFRRIKEFIDFVETNFVPEEDKKKWGISYNDAFWYEQYFEEQLSKITSYECTHRLKTEPGIMERYTEFLCNRAKARRTAEKLKFDIINELDMASETHNSSYDKLRLRFPGFSETLTELLCVSYDMAECGLKYLTGEYNIAACLFTDMNDVYIMCEGLKKYTKNDPPKTGPHSLRGFSWIEWENTHGKGEDQLEHKLKYTNTGSLLCKKLMSLKEFSEGKVDAKEIAGYLKNLNKWCEELILNNEQERR